MTLISSNVGPRQSGFGRSERGYSLLELGVVIVVLGTLAATFWSKYSASVAKSEAVSWAAATKEQFDELRGAMDGYYWTLYASGGGAAYLIDEFKPGGTPRSLPGGTVELDSDPTVAVPGWSWVQTFYLRQTAFSREQCMAYVSAVDSVVRQILINGTVVKNNPGSLVAGWQGQCVAGGNTIDLRDG